MKFLFFIFLTFSSLAVIALENPGPAVEMSIEEIFSLPGANRVAFLKTRGREFSKKLETMAFDSKEDFRMRWRALTGAAVAQGSDSEPLLKKALKSSDWFMRNAALLSYQEIFPSKARAVALQLLQDKALVVRSAAVEVLSKKLSDEDRESLWDQMSEKKNYRGQQSLYIRGQVLQVLAADPVEKEKKLFLTHLEDSDPRLHPFAVGALEKITARKMGKASDSIEAKRALWIQWAKTQKAQEIL